MQGCALHGAPVEPDHQRYRCYKQDEEPRSAQGSSAGAEAIRYEHRGTGKAYDTQPADKRPSFFAEEKQRGEDLKRLFAAGDAAREQHSFSGWVEGASSFYEPPCNAGGKREEEGGEGYVAGGALSRRSGRWHSGKERCAGSDAVSLEMGIPAFRFLTT